MRFWPLIKSRNKRIFADAAAGVGNPSSLHKEGAAAKRELEAAREDVAGAIKAHPDEIVFTSGGTEGNNLAIFGTLRPLLREHKEVHAITTAIEHPSVLEPLHALVKEGLVLTELGVGEDGLIDIKELRESITEYTALVSVQMVNSEIGTVQNIKEIAKEIRHARRRLATPARALQKATPSLTLASSSEALPYFHCDASQAPLWLPLAVESLGVDMLTLDAQKLFAPKGMGALYVRRSIYIEPIILGGGQEKGMRSGTESAPLAREFAAALLVAQNGVEERVRKISHLRNFTLEEIKRLIPDIVVNGSIESRVANNLNISIPHLDGQMAVIAMDAEGVAISTRSACSEEDEELSYVLLAISASPEQAKSAIRITLMPDATDAEAKQIAQKLSEITLRYRNK